MGSVITSTNDLIALCKRLADEPYVTIDTEFLRTKTYFAKLCLVQVAGADEVAAIDSLAEGMDLAPLYALLKNEKVLKVFHSARQDLEIFYHMMGDDTLPHPVFDTQIAAMVCGHGDAASYEKLVKEITGHQLDKSQRFTDWSRRPLSGKQLEYALSDVTYLREVYEVLAREMREQKREHWIGEEMGKLLDLDVYRVQPEEAWRRLKIRVRKPKFLAVVRELAAWREEEAQRRDLPRGHVMKDDTLMEIAAVMPKDGAALGRLRGVQRGMRPEKEKAILDAVTRGKALPISECPSLSVGNPALREMGPTLELLKVLLKLVCEDYHVVPRLVASSDDLQAIALAQTDVEFADISAMQGWRGEIFGAVARELRNGKIALRLNDGALDVIAVDV